MADMARPKNPRVQLVKDLRTLKNFTGDVLSRWNIGKKVYVSLADRQPGDSAYMRERLPHEYPENSKAEWERFANEARSMSEAWARLARVAQYEADDL